MIIYEIKYNNDTDNFYDINKIFSKINQLKEADINKNYILFFFFDYKIICEDLNIMIDDNLNEYLIYIMKLIFLKIRLFYI